MDAEALYVVCKADKYDGELQFLSMLKLRTVYDSREYTRNLEDAKIFTSFGRASAAAVLCGDDAAYVQEVRKEVRLVLA